MPITSGLEKSRQALLELKAASPLIALVWKSVDRHRIRKLKSHGLPVKIVLAKRTLTRGGRAMVQQRNIINRKLNILELDATLGNIREACLRLGASRQRCYDIVQTLEQEGMDDLQGRTPGETLREGLKRYDQHACDVLDGRRRRSTIHPGKPNGQP